MKLIDKMNDKELRELLQKTTTLDESTIKYNLNILIKQWEDFIISKDGKYRKSEHELGVKRMVRKKAIYQLALFIKQDASGPTRLKSELLYGMD